jgi:hypothetical protein
MELVILKRCEGWWLNRRQSGQLLDRKGDSLRARFLSLMLERWLIKVCYPDEPNRTDWKVSEKGFEEPRALVL